MTSGGFSPLFSVVVPSAIKGERLARGESFWSEKMNQQVIADHLSIVDDGLMEGGMSWVQEMTKGSLVVPNQ